MKKELVELGFTENEAAVYLALLEVGPCGAGEIGKKAQMHRFLVYDALERLAARHLVTKFVRNKVAQFKAASPDRLVELAEAQGREAKERIETARKAAEELSKKADLKTDIALWQGEDAFRAFHLQLLDKAGPGDTIYVLGSNGEDWYRIMGEDLPRYERKFIKKQINLKMVAYREYAKNVQFAQHDPRVEIRVIPAGFEAPANVNIWKDTAFLQVMVGVPTIVEMRGKELAEAYMNYFRLMWDTPYKSKDIQGISSIASENE